MYTRLFSLLLVLTAVLTLSVGCQRNTFAVSSAQAKAIALADAGLTDEQVTWLRADPDREDGKVVYDVSFRHGDTEYEYDIDATTGEIVHKDVDRDGQRTTTNVAVTTTTAITPTTTATAASTTAVTAEQAQAIALADAGFTPDQVTSLRSEQELDDGRTHFEVEFRVDQTEYHYEIDAESGAILEKDVDRWD